MAWSRYDLAESHARQLRVMEIEDDLHSACFYNWVYALDEDNCDPETRGAFPPTPHPIEELRSDLQFTIGPFSNVQYLRGLECTCNYLRESQLYIGMPSTRSYCKATVSKIPEARRSQEAA